MNPAASGFRFPQRKRPAQWPTFENGNQSVLVFVTVCTHERRPLLANPRMHAELVAAWQLSNWAVGRYMIMPDHLHLFCSPTVFPPAGLRQWVSYWKSLTALHVEGKLWQRNCWDRQLRSGESYSEKWQYVRQNPVRANLVKASDDWPYQGELNILRWHDR
jgi:putative transposase